MARGKGLLGVPARARDGSVHVVVESPRGSTSKFRFDPDLSVIALSRPLPEGLAYPHDWGFVPSTRSEDGEPLDAMIVWDRSSYPGVVVACRSIGVLLAEQTNQETGKRAKRSSRHAASRRAAGGRGAHGRRLRDRMRSGL